MSTVGKWSVTFVRMMGRAIIDSYKLGIRAALEAPAIVALGILPEFAQHVAEISVGMFDSKARAHEIANSAMRLDFGYVKIVGLTLAILLVARFWARGASVKAALAVPPSVLGRSIVAMVALSLAVLGIGALRNHLPTTFEPVLFVSSWLLQTGIIVWLIGELLEDPNVSLWGAFTSRFMTIGWLIILLLAAFMPAMLVHALNHKLAMEQPRAVAWALMGFDAIVIGLMAAIAGSAMYVGYNIRLDNDERAKN